MIDRMLSILSTAVCRYQLQGLASRFQGSKASFSMVVEALNCLGFAFLYFDHFLTYQEDKDGVSDEREADITGLPV